MCKDGKCLVSTKRGISPMMDFIAEGVMLSAYSVADLIVGKATAMLFVKSGIKAVFAKTISQSGKNFLQMHGVHCEYETLAEKIINREGTDICPMEKAVLATDDVEEGYLILKAKLAALRGQK